MQQRYRLQDHPDAARVMGENGQVAIRDRYHWAAVEGRLTEVYRQIETRKTHD